MPAILHILLVTGYPGVAADVRDVTGFVPCTARAERTRERRKQYARTRILAVRAGREWLVRREMRTQEPAPGSAGGSMLVSLSWASVPSGRLMVMMTLGVSWAGS
jgi:hypothetical protein